MDKPPQTLGAIVRQRVEATGLTQEEVAARTGIPRTTMARHYATGAFTYPQLVAIAELLGTTAQALVSEDEGAAA